MHSDHSTSNDLIPLRAMTAYAQVQEHRVIPSPHDPCLDLGQSGFHEAVFVESTPEQAYFISDLTELTPYAPSESDVTASLVAVAPHSMPISSSHLLSELLQLPGFPEAFHRPLQQRLAALSPPGLCSMCGTPSPAPFSVPPTPISEPIPSRSPRAKPGPLPSQPRFHPYSRQSTKRPRSSALGEDSVMDEVPRDNSNIPILCQTRICNDEIQYSTKKTSDMLHQVPENHQKTACDRQTNQPQEVLDISDPSSDEPSPPTFEILPIAQQASLLGVQEQELRREQELQRKQEEEQRIFWMDSPMPPSQAHPELSSPVVSTSLDVVPDPSLINVPETARPSSCPSTTPDTPGKDSSQDHGYPSSLLCLDNDTTLENNNECLGTDITTCVLSSTNPGDQSKKRLIGHTTPLLTIIDHLVKDGCADVTLQLTQINDHSRYSGSLSDVYQARWLDGSMVAVKCLRALSNSDVPQGKILKHTARELYTWSRASHRNVLKLHGLAVVCGKLAMVASWMEYGSLLAYIRAQPKVDRCSLCAQIAAGLEYMHDMGLVHGDIKGNNVVVSRDGVAKITDFGSSTMAREFAIAFTATQTVNYSIRWAAPELFASQPACFKTDVYAFAKTVLEALTGDIPHKGLSDFAVMGLVGLKGALPERPTEYIPPQSKKGDMLWNHLSLCWSPNASQRPTILEALVFMDDMSQEDLAYIP
ncbi:unnamed protein product [Rhizoctonia solani]|uniref:Protein kinase domain-containing protein n=1 Tax=Rhizoctonia solani TaxID=456999 RepID=A0A8H3GKH1_9AGAM|nr:unnamed protein product [Rhizoctonia solani]